MTAEDIVKSFQVAYPHWCIKCDITKEENAELCKKIKNGDKDAELELICRNLHLVVAMCKRYYKGEYIEDAVIGSLMALLTAAKKFDESKETAFATYATFWIKQYIFRDIPIFENGIQIAPHMQPIINKIRKNQDENLDIKELAAKYDITHEAATAISPHLLTSLSIDKQYGNKHEDESFNIGSILVDDNVDVEDTAIQTVFCDSIYDIMQNILTEDEFSVIVRRHGLFGNIIETLDEIAKSCQPQITRERVRQIEINAIQKLRYSPALLAVMKEEYPHLLSHFPRKSKQIKSSIPAPQNQRKK